MIENEINIILPLPPSVNALYKNSNKGRIKTEAYKDFERSIWLQFIQMDKRYTIKWNNWLEVQYDVCLPCYTSKWKIKKVDLENYVKAVSDVLWKNIEWFDDSRIMRMILNKYDSKSKRVIVKIKEI